VSIVELEVMVSVLPPKHVLDLPEMALSFGEQGKRLFISLAGAVDRLRGERL